MDEGKKKPINTREPNGELGPDVRFPLFFGNIGNLDCTVTGYTLGFYLVLHLVFRRTRGLRGLGSHIEPEYQIRSSSHYKTKDSSDSRVHNINGNLNCLIFNVISIREPKGFRLRKPSGTNINCKLWLLQTITCDCI